MNLVLDNKESHSTHSLMVTGNTSNLLPSNPVLRLKTRWQTCVGGISHLNLVNWTLDMKNQ